MRKFGDTFVSSFSLRHFDEAFGRNVNRISLQRGLRIEADLIVDSTRPCVTALLGTMTKAEKSASVSPAGVFTFSGYRPGFIGASHVHLFGPVATSAPCGASMLCSRVAGARDRQRNLLAGHREDRAFVVRIGERARAEPIRRDPVLALEQRSGQAATQQSERNLSGAFPGHGSSCLSRSQETALRPDAASCPYRSFRNLTPPSCTHAVL